MKVDTDHRCKTVHPTTGESALKTTANCNRSKSVLQHWALCKSQGGRGSGGMLREAEAEAGGSLSVLDQPTLQEIVPEQAPKLQRNPVWKKQKDSRRLKGSQQVKVTK